MRRGIQHVGMVIHAGAIDTRAVGLELLLRRQQRRLGACKRVARMVLLFRRNGAGTCQPLAAREVIGRLGEVGLAHRDGCLQLRGRGK